MICEECGRDNATVKFVAFTPNGRVEKNLCTDCMHKMQERMGKDKNIVNLGTVHLPWNPTSNPSGPGAKSILDGIVGALDGIVHQLANRHAAQEKNDFAPDSPDSFDMEPLEPLDIPDTFELPEELRFDALKGEESEGMEGSERTTTDTLDNPEDKDIGSRDSGSDAAGNAVTEAGIEAGMETGLEAGAAIGEELSTQNQDTSEAVDNSTTEQTQKEETESKEQDTERYCVQCGNSWAQFSKNHFAGCPGCYDVFRESLEELFREMTGKSQHTGHKPGKESGTVSKTLELDSLKQKLKQVIEKEQYEEAAVLRDRIRDLQNRILAETKNTTAGEKQTCGGVGKEGYEWQ